MLSVGEAVASVLLVGAASGAVALAVTRGKLFAWLRIRMPGILGDLVSCPFCLGAYTAAGFCAIQGRPLGLNDWVYWGAAWAVSTAVSGALERLLGD